MTREEYGSAYKKGYNLTVRFLVSRGLGEGLGASRAITRRENGAYLDEQHRSQHPPELHAARAFLTGAAGTFYTS